MRLFGNHSIKSADGSRADAFRWHVYGVCICFNLIILVVLECRLSDAECHSRLSLSNNIRSSVE